MDSAEWTNPLDDAAVRHARVLPLDVVQAKGSGHAGTAVSLTPFLYILFQEYLRHDPSDPEWIGRDRFVLSCGHASLALYLQLYLSGYGLEMDDLRATRTLDSLTPGHPEYGHTSGVETTTGPLGQGLGNAVGMALAARRVRGMLDPDAPTGESPFDHRVFCLVSDGDLEEGISHESASLAGALALDGLVVIWDDNGISIEGDTRIAVRDDTAARMRAYGWSVVEIEDAESPDAIHAGLDRAIEPSPGPTLIRLRTRIGSPMPTVAGTARAHAGAPGAEEVAATKELLGLDPAQSFAMPGDVLTHARGVQARGHGPHEAWSASFDAWRNAHPENARLVDRLLSRTPPVGWAERLPEFPPGEAIATRIASSRVLAEAIAVLPELWGGSADLADSNGTNLDGLPSMTAPGATSDEWPGDEYGRMLHFGIREHASAAVANGIALDGLTRIFAATYLVFSDYLRPAARLAALMRLPVTYVWTHDSVMVGEDGPTHQPVEQLWANRLIPGLNVVRPADANETVAAWRRILETFDAPHALCLSRQVLPVLENPGRALAGTRRGGYVVAGDADPDAIIMATGSEVTLALEARRRLAEEGVAARVVSMPCLEWFDQEPAEYRDAVLPPEVRARVSVEAGATAGWHRYLGTEGVAVGVDGFGASGAGPAVLERMGVTADAVVAAVLRSRDAVRAAFPERTPTR